jgi:methionine-rich copper-binding protein CopC
MRKFLVSVIVCALAVLAVPTSFAHGKLVSSSPEQYANANPIPTQVWIEFDGNLQNLDGQAINTIDVVDSTGITVSYGDPIIAGGRITTKLSGQSAPGVFTVKYRIVSEDGHPVEGSYTFNASPDYAEAVPTTTSADEESPSLNIGGIVLVIFLIVFVAGYIIKERNDKKK